MRSVAAKREALEFIGHVLDVRPRPASWDAGLFLGHRVLQRALASIDSTRIEYRGDIAPLRGLSLSIKDMKLTGDAVPEVSLTVEAALGKTSVSLGLSAYVSLSSVEAPAEKGAPSLAVIRILPVSVDPKLTLDGKVHAPDKLWSAAALDLANALIQPKLLEFRVPIARDFDITFPKDADDTMEVKETGGKVNYHVNYPDGGIKGSVWYSGPVLTASGFWMFGFLDSAGALQSFKAPDIWYYDLPQRIAELSARVGTSLQPLERAGPDHLAFHVGSGLFANLSGFLDTLKPEQRVIGVTTVSASGLLHNDEWRDNILGRGGITAKLDPADSGRLDIGFRPPQLAWQNDSMRLDLAFGARFKGDFEVHVDPFIGGGIGVPVHLEGDAGGAVGVNGIVQLLNRNGARALQFVPSVACATIPVDINGGIGFDKGWVSIGGLGLRILYPVGNKQPDKMAILDNRPTFLDLKSLAADASTDDWELKTRYRALVVRAVPAEAIRSADGFLGTATLGLLQVPAGTDDATTQMLKQIVESEEDHISRVVAESLPTPDNPACDGEKHMRLLVLGFEIGPNNELVKFAEALGEALADAGEALKQLHKDATKAAEDALNGIGHEIANVFGW
jgi:hypothetical protein